MQVGFLSLKADNKAIWLSLKIDMRTMNLINVKKMYQSFFPLKVHKLHVAPRF